MGNGQMHCPYKGPAKILRRLSGQLIHEIDADIPEARPVSPLHCLFRFRRGMAPADGLKQPVIL